MKRSMLRGLAIALLLLLTGAGVGLVMFQAKQGKFLSVQTGSMEPNIHTGGLVAVTRVNPASLKPGDIITYSSPVNERQTITHRVVGYQENPMLKGQKFLITKGDANAANDAPVPMGAVVGKVRASVPYMGHVFDFIRRPIGLLALVYLPALIVVITEIRKLMAYYKSQEPYVLPEILARRQKPGHAGRNALIVLVCGVATLGVALPARAAMLQQVTLAGNTISTAETPEPQPATEGVTLRRVFVTCTPDNLIQPDHLDIILYNGTMQNATITGWYLQSGATKLYTFPKTTVLARSTYDVESPVAEGQNYGAGSLELRNAAGQLIDSQAWDHIAKDRTCQSVR